MGAMHAAGRLGITMLNWALWLNTYLHVATYAHSDPEPLAGEGNYSRIENFHFIHYILPVSMVP